MISVEKAVQIVLDSMDVLESVKVPILSARGRVLGEDIVSAENIPSFDYAAINGYALRSEDIANTSANKPIQLSLDGELMPGSSWDKQLKPKHIVKISSGAQIPKDADCVIQEEHVVRQTSKKVLVYKSVPSGDHIRFKGEDISKGTLTLAKGKKLNAHDIGMMSAIGITEVECHRNPRIAFLTSGKGLADNCGPLPANTIRPSNRYTLYSQLSEYGAEPVDLGLAGNDKQSIQTKIIEGLDYDMFISTVGPSMDDFTFAKRMLEQLGMDIKFWRVAIKPARPFIFGICGDIPVFGLSGHPFSFFIILEQFIRPAIMKMTGCPIVKRTEVQATLTRDLRADNGSTSFTRGTVSISDTGFDVTPELKKSNSIRAFSTANGLIVIPANSGYLSAGSKVTVQILADPVVSNHVNAY
ncbi:MAG: molybdopterin molybdotransferase MoeA [candidate division Zixibacteria bacterium]|nr:molybdopterin molybdotransferase MoeA [candidate division Zixibacteria bacterium]